MLDDGRAHKRATGESMMVSRYDIVPIPVHLRVNEAVTTWLKTFFPVTGEPVKHHVH